MDNKKFSEIGLAKKIGRILLIPFVFLWGVFMLCAGTLFPIPMLMMISGIMLFCMPFKWLFRKSGVEVREDDFPFISATRFNSINHFLGLTIYVWGAFAVVYIYVVNGVFFTGNE